jgi:uncharacterized membrane protein YcaP (DUF421 family)
MPDITNIPDLGSGLVSIAIRSAVIFIFLVVALRLGGKREVGQLTTPDLVVLLIVSNAVQNAMVGENTTVLGGIVATVTIIVLARLTQVLTNRSKLVEDVLIGKPRILAIDGVLDEQAMREEEVTDEELQAAIREHGMESLADVHLVVLEVDGSISVVPVEPGTSSGGPGTHRAGHLPRQSRRVGRRSRVGTGHPG